MIHSCLSFAVAIAGLWAVGGPAVAQQSPCWVYIAGKEAISLFWLDPVSHTLEARGIAAPIGAGFLAFSPDQKFVYATTTEVDADHKRIGEALAFAVDRASGRLTLLDRQPSQGDGPCFVTVDPQGKNVLVANYSSATVAVFPLAADGSMRAASCVIKQTGSSIDPQRQTHAYAHSVNLDHAGRFAFVADLGADKLFIYRFDSEAGKLVANEPPAIILPPGSGPRHFAFAPSGRFAYLINEMGGTVAVYSYDANEGTLQEKQLISTLPENFKGGNTCAEVQVDPAGRFLYASDRGDTNWIAMYRIDPLSGMLSLIGNVSTLGRTPRNFRIDPSGKFLIAANQDSNSIVLFAIDQETGTLSAIGKPLSVTSPTCVKFLPATSP